MGNKRVLNIYTLHIWVMHSGPNTTNSIIILIYLSFWTKKCIKINIESSCQEIWIIIGVLEINRLASLLKSFRTYINTVISIRSERPMVQIWWIFLLMTMVVSSDTTGLSVTCKTYLCHILWGHWLRLLSKHVCHWVLTCYHTSDTLVLSVK